MTKKAKKVEPVAPAPFWHIARDAYPNDFVDKRALDTIDKITYDDANIGDTLFTFVCVECAEVSEDETDKRKALEAMRGALDVAIANLEHVCEEINVVLNRDADNAKA